ncbi:ABC transporter permease subunit [Bacillus sp. CGMCC 1.16541]|uniref:ABC transporter permease subunit n=1 Tax=Bacillus sp. CGMCC 1.16541 TaxID=2185143 RepID=UPI000D735A2A|nr:ABC transporter permease subunit [Bacillus sp. CGMCC 1.16541]
MSRALFFTMLKGHGKSISSYTIGSTFYLLLIVMIYPSVSNVKGLNDIIASMPENFLKAFGIEGGLSSLSDFLAGEYYGLLLLVILSIYCITTATGSLAKLVDNGSMAYLLATPNSRVKIAITQAMVGVTGLVTILGVTTLAGILGGTYLIETSDFDVIAFVQMNVAAFFLFFVISSYSFFFSSLMNDEKKALSIPAVLTVIFYALDLIGKMSEKFEWMRNLSLFSLFNPIEIGRGNEDILAFCIIFGSIAILIYSISIWLL